MALFCAACPQHGVNLKDNWKADPNRNLYIRNFVSDGNFKADHVKQKNIDDDVYLSSGEGYMTEPKDYAAHVEEMVKIAPRFKHVSYLSNVCTHFFAGYFLQYEVWMPRIHLGLSGKNEANADYIPEC